jgi:hypothetical protein
MTLSIIVGNPTLKKVFIRLVDKDYIVLRQLAGGNATCCQGTKEFSFSIN